MSVSSENLFNFVAQPVDDVVTKVEQSIPSVSCVVNELEIIAKFNNFSCKDNGAVDHITASRYLTCIASLLFIGTNDTVLEKYCSGLVFDHVGTMFADCEWCTEKYECFQVGGPFISNCHPISLPPQPESCLDLKLQLYTVSNIETPQLLKKDLSNIGDTNFNLKEKTVILIGGWENGNMKPYDRVLIEAILSSTKQNVVLFDWSKGSGTLYGQSIANARLLGRMLARFIEDLNDKLGYSPSMVHLVGHSTGSQLAGYVGEKFLAIGRITGLDPAGPYFHCGSATVRLDPTDAVFVDSIHTNAGAFGTIMRAGDVDFWPNGGTFQVGCDPFRRLLDPSLNDKIGCEHAISIYFFASSVQNSNCKFNAHMCNNFEDFEKGKCNDCGKNNSRCARMGWFAEEYFHAGYQIPAEESFYLTTAPDSPYCLDPEK